MPPEEAQGPPDIDTLDYGQMQISPDDLLNTLALSPTAGKSGYPGNSSR